jgi:hypothetical protein
LELRRSRFFPQFRVDITLGTVDWACGRANRCFSRNRSATIHRCPKLLHLFRQQVAMFARMHIQRKRPVANALELLYVMAGLLKHRSNLAVASLN